MTWQASAKDKLALNYSNQYICNCYNTVNSNIPHEPATTLNGPNVKAQLTQATWNRPATNRFNGFDVSINARFADGVLLQGGVATGHTVSDNCTVVDSPQAARPDYCTQVLPLVAPSLGRTLRPAPRRP